MALPDLKPDRPGHHPARRESSPCAFDSTMTRYALRFRDGTIQVRRVADDQEIARFQARGDREHLGLRLQPRRPLPGDHASSRPCPDGLGHRPAHGRPERPGPVSTAMRPNSARTADGSPWSIRMASSSSTTWRPVSRAGAGAGRARGDLAFRPDGTQIAVIVQ